MFFALTRLRFLLLCLKKTVCTVTGTTAIKQPYIANLTVGCENFVDDRIKGFRTVSFDHLLTGERRFCQCHRKAHATMVSDAEAMASSYVPGSWPHRIIDLLENATYTDGCCHFCISERYGQEAHFEWYGSQIRQHFGPYVDLLVRDAGLDKRTAIAETRRRLSISRWVRQDQLCDLVAKIFSTHAIRREASPSVARPATPRHILAGTRLSHRASGPATLLSNSRIRWRTRIRQNSGTG